MPSGRGSCENPFQSRNCQLRERNREKRNNNSDIIISKRAEEQRSNNSSPNNPTQPNLQSARFRSRIKHKRNFIFCIWTVIFVYFSVSAHIQNRVHALPTDGSVGFSTWDPKESTGEELKPTTVDPKSFLLYTGVNNESVRGIQGGIGSGTAAPGLSGVTTKHGKTYGQYEVPGVNCTPPGIDDFPPDFFSQPERRSGWVVVHFLISMFIFYALALVCDDYFVPSMECICEELKMPTDVAGATFMAIATSAPELFTNIIGTFITKGDIGIGTIVGSAVFNILAVAAVCGIGAGMVVPLEWFSVTRDCLCYSLSVILLIIVLKDERIYWYEALVLVLVYTLYILAMYKNSTLKRGAERLVYSVERKLNLGKTETTYTMKENGNGNGTQIDTETPENRDEVLIENALKNLQDQAAAEKEEQGLFKPPHGQGCRSMCEWILGWPVRALYMLTIPDCRENKWRRWYPLTFFMCVVWIGILAYLVNWMMTVIGHTLQIPDSIMGLTFIAAGTSVPECVSSIIVARQGLGTMALSNSIGSNTFDILMCLGLPWLIRASIIADNKEINFIQINSTGLEYSTIMLITSLCVLYGILAMNKFVLDKKVGFLSLFLYGVFLVMASLFELNVFFKVNLPTCLYHEDPV